LRRVAHPSRSTTTAAQLFDGFAFGLVADDAAAAVAFEEDLQLLLETALTVDAIRLLHRMLLSRLRAVLSAGSWAGSFRGGF